MKIKKVEYNLKNEIIIDSDEGEKKISSKDALEIAYALFDCYGFKYDILEDLENIING